MKRHEHNSEISDEPGSRQNAMKFFYDVPVYRLAEETYYRDREKYVEEAMFPKGLPFGDELISQGKADPDSNLQFRDYLKRSYDGPWLYNEITG